MSKIFSQTQRPQYLHLEALDIAADRAAMSASLGLRHHSDNQGPHDWMLNVLMDLRQYAERHGLSQADHDLQAIAHRLSKDLAPSKDGA